MRTVKLIKVEPGANNNKYYDMVDDGTTIHCKFGRVGASEQTASYPSRKWNEKYNEKLRKGYKDVTDLYATVAKSLEYKPISDQEVNSIVNKLLSFTNTHVKSNYTVSSDSVTKQQIDDAQGLLNELSFMAIKDSITVEDFNHKLLALFHTIPRRMGKVSDYIVNANLLNSEIIESAKKIITNEQDTLDSMATKVSMNVVDDVENPEQTLLDVIGISMNPVSKKEETMLKKLLGEISDKYSKAFSVTNAKTQGLFLGDMPNKELLFHGSRNENFISILKTGLLIRPSSAVYSGSMFGDSLYFADKAKKSLGYTSLRGSYWAHGSQNTGYMAVFDVALGNQKHIYKHTSDCYRLSHDVLKKEGFDSVFAHGGADLVNNEKMVYHPSQCTIRYLVELN